MRGAAHVVYLLATHALVSHVDVLAHHVAELVFHQLAMEICEQCLRHTIVEARIKKCLVIYESKCRTFFVQEFRLRGIQLHILIARRYYAEEAAELEALPLHVLHGPTEVEDQIETKPIGYFHAPLKSISLSGCEYYVHLLICEMVLQKLLVFEAIRGARNHADVQRLYQDLHRHY